MSEFGVKIKQCLQNKMILKISVNDGHFVSVLTCQVNRCVINSWRWSKQYIEVHLALPLNIRFLDGLETKPATATTLCTSHEQWESYRHVAQIPQCTSHVSHTVPLSNRNMHICARLLQNGALWDIHPKHCVVVGFLRWIYRNVRHHVWSYLDYVIHSPRLMTQF